MQKDHGKRTAVVSFGNSTSEGLTHFITFHLSTEQQKKLLLNGREHRTVCKILSTCTFFCFATVRKPILQSVSWELIQDLRVPLEAEGHFEAKSITVHIKSCRVNVLE